MRMLQAILCLALSLVVGGARADSWAPPQTNTYASSDGNWRLIVVPRDVESPLSYFEDKAAGRPNAGSLLGETRNRALGRVERFEGGSWRAVWQQPLSNEVAPVIAVVADDGRIATFDNWHGAGYGKNVVVIYDGCGKLVRALSLSDFLPPEYIEALPHSVSSIEWRGEPRIEGQRLIVPVVVPSIEHEEAEAETRYVEVKFDLASGERVADAGAAWSGALESARKTLRATKQSAAENRAWFIAPLAAPRGSEPVEWHQYLVEAYFRLGGQGYPATDVIPLRKEADFKLMVKYLRESLAGEDGSLLMIASPSQDLLVEVLRSEASKVKPGALAKVKVYVVVDAAHLAAVRDAIAPLGGEFIPLDPTKAIPQDPARLERFLRPRGGDSDE